ncbi:MAG: penicillin-binding protein 2 [Blastocatellia bacterium]|nr:penicillin-binding protein 2 [Blastocatellia bacterium]
MDLKLNELAEKARKVNEGHRLAIIQYGLVLSFVAIILRLWSLQVIHHEEYLKRAENNRLKTLPILAPRGFVFDREGRVLIENNPSLTIIMNREEVQARGRTVMEVVNELKIRGLALDTDLISGYMNAVKRRPSWYPIVIKENATTADVAWVRAHQLEYPELDIVEQPIRRYPDGPLLAHVLGYVSEISPQELEQPEFKDYRPGDIIGKAGIEKYYDSLLRGKDGMRRVVVDSTGREIEELDRVDPVPGRDLRLTIDLDLQRVAEEQLADRRGVVIAMDPRNGEILAMVSHPSFDPNLFSQRIKTPAGKEEYQALLRDRQLPLYNRAIQGTYPSGSTWKPLIAVAALEERVITRQDSRILCGGGIQIGNRFTRCMGSHGAPDVHNALRVSCDGYFYRLGLKLGVDRMHEWVKSMGLGQRTGIDLPGEREGIIPGRHVKRRNPRDPEWRDHDTVIASVGQGAVAITPLQLLRAYAGIAMGGVLHTPHLLLEVGAPGPRTPYQDDRPLRIRMSKETHELVAKGLWAVVNEGGTGTRAAVKGFDVSGKTGTAQVVALHKTRGEFKDHAWFAAFAPLDKPEIAVVVLIENIGFGGTHSAPVAGAIFEAYYRKHHAPPSQTQIAQRDQANTSSSAARSGVTTSVPANAARPTTPSASPAAATAAPARAVKPPLVPATAASAGRGSSSSVNKPSQAGAASGNRAYSTGRRQSNVAAASASTSSASAASPKPTHNNSSGATTKHRPRTVTQQARRGQR